MINIAIFASGGGSNAREIMSYFNLHPEISVSLVVCNKKDAGVIAIANNFNIKSVVISKEHIQSKEIIQLLDTCMVSYIVLAGFLWLIPTHIIKKYPNKILNIHPSLLPKYGGKGMFGINVHSAVKAAGDPISGMTIHLVNEKYDDGTILFQAKCELDHTMTVEEIAKSVLALEHQYYSKVIEQYINSTSKSEKLQNI